jgi:hypothetical protein
MSGFIAQRQAVLQGIDDSHGRFPGYMMKVGMNQLGWYFEKMSILYLYFSSHQHVDIASANLSPVLGYSWSLDGIVQRFDRSHVRELRSV